MLKPIYVIFIAMLLGSATGCSDIVKFAVDKTQPRGVQQQGVVYYIGGAGPVGNIGSFDVPRGMRDAGFRGLVEVVPWQSWTHAGDQLNISRNRAKAAELADQIQRFRRRHPDAPIHIIALSAGTGIATFALEYLPESFKVDNIIYLGCSMSSGHDMTRALRRVQGKLYVLYSRSDVILSNLVWYTGTVDRKESRDGIAGLEGFHRISSPYPDTEKQYQKLVNVPYRSDFRDGGYDGGHVSATTKTFVQYYLAPAMMDSDRRLVGGRRASPRELPRYAESSRKDERVTARTKRRPLRSADDPSRTAERTTDGRNWYDVDLDVDRAPSATEWSSSGAGSTVSEGADSSPRPSETEAAETTDYRDEVFERENSPEEAVGG